MKLLIKASNWWLTFELGLYRFFLWFAEFDLAIAMSTGRNPQDIAIKRQDVASLAGIVDTLEINK